MIKNITFYSYKRVVKCLLEYGTAWPVEANALVAAFYLEKKIAKRLKSLREENYDYGYEGGVMLCK